MAAFNVKSTLQTVQSALMKMGYFPKAEIGEPKSPPTEPMAAALFMSNAAVAETTLGTTIELHVVTVRFYRRIFEEKEETIEYEMAEVLSKLMSDLLGDFDLGATIRSIDVGGQYGTAPRGDWGYVDVGGVMFRTVDLTLPLIVDDSASFTA